MVPFSSLVPSALYNVSGLDDMVGIFIPHKYTYMGKANDTVIPTRYESLYAIDYLPKF